MEITIKIPRQDKNSAGKWDTSLEKMVGGTASEQSYTLDIDPGTSVLDALVKIREEQDGSLAFRGSCRTGMCGDCTLGSGRDHLVSCLTTVESAANKEGEIALTTMHNTEVIKDLLMDWNQFIWDKYKSVRPWIVSNGTGQKPVTEEALEPVRKAMRCTACGLCDDGCTVIDIDKTFLGPAALTKLYRFVRDPRDTDTVQPFKEAGERRGLWDCVHCWEASEHCPWGIEPSHVIVEMREQSVSLGVKSGKGNPMVARHYDAFAKSVCHSGWLDERALASKSYGLPPYGFSPSGIISQAPIAMKAIRRGKASLLPHPKRPGQKEVEKIFKRSEEINEKES